MTLCMQSSVQVLRNSLKAFSFYCSYNKKETAIIGSLFKLTKRKNSLS